MPVLVAPPEAAPRGRLRDLLAQLTGAILVAVLLKGFCLEAYAIPSPSMQPTLLGCDEAGVYDRVLVDKARYLLHAPQRWDLAVFRAPLQQRDLFVKRLCGLPGERLAIAGGNLYRLDGDGEGLRFSPLRRPAALVAAQWRQVHPARALVRGEPTGLGSALRGEPAARWHDTASGPTVALQADQTAELTFVDADGGLVERVWDGHPLAVAQALRAAHGERSWLAEIVPDARLSLSLRPTATVTHLQLQLTVRRPALPTLTFALAIDDGQGRLLVQQGEDRRVVTAGAPFPCPLPAGRPTALAFAHVDDELVAWGDGAELARLDTAAFPVRDGCELPDPCGMGAAMPLPEQCVVPSLQLRGQGEAGLGDLQLCRDQHWSKGTLPGGRIEVPAGHYFLLGDNPPQSQDGRGFGWIEVEQLDGSAVPPGTTAAQRLRGSRCVVSAEVPPARDENPIFFPARRRLLFADQFGNRHVLRAAPGPLRSYDEVSLHWQDAGGQDHDWLLPGGLEHCVPAGNLVGRALLRFWPVPPFGPFRAGLLR